MLFGITTVVGFMVSLAIVGFTIMYFLKYSVIAHDSEVVDPIPEKKY